MARAVEFSNFKTLNTGIAYVLEGAFKTLRPLSQTRVRTGGVRGKKIRSRTQWTSGITNM